MWLVLDLREEWQVCFVDLLCFVVVGGGVEGGIDQGGLGWGG